MLTRRDTPKKDSVQARAAAEKARAAIVAQRKQAAQVAQAAEQKRLQALAEVKQLEQLRDAEMRRITAGSAKAGGSGAINSSQARREQGHS